jgi:hypothetical protein
VVNRAEAGDWEKFFYEQVPAELVPAEEAEHTRVEGALGESVVDAVQRQARQSRIDLSAPALETPEEPGRTDTVSDARRRFP